MKIQEKVSLFAKTHYKRVEPESIIQPEHCFSNSACHFNSVNSVRNGRADKVWLCFVDSDDDGVIHFINSKNGKFFDETWHYRANEKYHYYLIREVSEREFDDIYNVLVDVKKMFYQMLGNWLDKIKAKRNVHWGL